MDLHEAINALQNLGVSLNDYDSEALDIVCGAALKVTRLERFAKDCATNFDCDSDAHRYNTPCRACRANDLVDA